MQNFVRDDFKMKTNLKMTMCFLTSIFLNLGCNSILGFEMNHDAGSAIVDENSTDFTTDDETDSETSTETETENNSCTENIECTIGDCCEKSTCKFKSSSFICKTWTEYRCLGASCGAELQIKNHSQYCSGNSNSCDGIVEGSWLTFETCDADEMCKVDGTTSGECIICTDGCNSTTNNCNTECNPTGSCCEDDGTNCVHGCDGVNCYQECNPAETCCNNDGTLRTNEDEVQQPGTNLYWKRCSLGQTWTTSCLCTGSTVQHNWDNAMNACPSGYRLPTREEFIQLLGDCDSEVTNGGEGPCDACHPSQPNPSETCINMFDSTTPNYWSSSVVATNTDRAWVADFGIGYISTSAKHFSNWARCVRSGP